MTDAFRRYEAKLRLGTVQPQVHRGLEEISTLPTVGSATGTIVRAFLCGSENCSQVILVTRLAQCLAVAAGTLPSEKVSETKVGKSGGETVLKTLRRKVDCALTGDACGTEM